ncbi:unnamed protein product, partial [Iphiclides podalirius]
MRNTDNAAMATICQTIEENLLQHKCEPNCPCKNPPVCPPGCPCRKESRRASTRLFFNALGILVAVLATYMIVTSDSKLYLVFWISYSILRRMMVKNKRGHAKAA